MIQKYRIIPMSFKLKGVGPYIGGAVQSIAFNNQLAAVDGNVLRYVELNRDKRDIQKHRSRMLKSI